MSLKEAPCGRARDFSAWHSHRLEIVTVPTSHTGILKNHNTLGRVHIRALSYWWRISSLTMKTAPVPPNKSLKQDTRISNCL